MAVKYRIKRQVNNYHYNRKSKQSWKFSYGSQIPLDYPKIHHSTIYIRETKVFKLSFWDPTLMALGLNRSFLLLVRQFCDEHKLHKTVRMLEQETGCFFDLKYFEGLVLSSNWIEAENYLSGFTRIQDNENSYKIYLEIRKQKYLEAIEIRNVSRAMEILTTDLKVFRSSNEDLYNELTFLLTMDDFRTHSSFSMYRDMADVRKNVMNQIKLLIGENPKFQKKLEFPQIEKSRLVRLVNRSVQKQQVHRSNAQPKPQVPRTTPVEARASKSIRTRLNQSSVPNLQISSSSTANFVNVSNQAIFAGSSSRGCITPLDNMMASNQINHFQNVDLTSDLAEFPKTVKRSMNMRETSTCMDFHPVNETLLLVGNVRGEIELWDVSSEVRLFWNPFTIWGKDDISVPSLMDTDRDQCILINRVLWSPNGLLFGVALSKHVVQLYAYNSRPNRTQKHLEIYTHHGSVNDIAFSSQEDKLYVISCGDDKLIKVWDVVTGSKQFTFEGHSDPVYSLCPHFKENVHYVFSTSRSGEIKAWVFDNIGPQIQITAPHNSCIRMAYTTDGKRLFSCGTSKAGESMIWEWDDVEGHIIHKYNGLSNKSGGFVKFSIYKSHFLAAGDEHVIKVWSVGSVQLLTIIQAEGDLPTCPCICFNKTGSLMAVFADNNIIKILANDVGKQILQTINLPGSVRNLAINASSAPRMTTESVRVPGWMGGRGRTQRQLISLNASRFRFLRLPSDVNTSKICRLVYTFAGNEIVALTADGIHLVWRWSGTESNNYGWATTNYAPQLYPLESGPKMMNVLGNDSSQLVSPILALSNDSYLISGSGTHASLFSMVTFQKLGSYLMPPPAATCVSYFPPDNNILAVGMDDATILIYNVHHSEIIHRLQGHVKRISALDFSTRSRLLVSAGIDSQIIVWDYINNYLRKQNTWLEISTEWKPSETSETSVQFFKDGRHILVVHETQLVIYETTSLARVQKWVAEQTCRRISHATLSSDNLILYAVLRNGILLIFNARDLIPAFNIDPSVYLPHNLSCCVYPQVVAENPQKPSQFAVGLSDGGIVVIEPHEFIGRWLTLLQ